MLGARLASAAVLIPAVLALLYLGAETTAVATALASVVGAYELYSMAQRSAYQYRPVSWLGYLAAPLFSLAAYLRQPYWLLLIAGSLIIVALPLALYARSLAVSATSTGMSGSSATSASPVTSNQPSNWQLMNWLLTVFGAIYVGIPLALLTFVRADLKHPDGLWWILLICLGTWGTDTGAYFFGRFFGKHKLAPKISPKKTIEGAIGGVAVGTLGVVLVGVFALQLPLWLLLPLGIVLAVVSVLGDLFESWMKRRFDAKDSSKLIPGHGGLLDRVDSFVAVIIAVFPVILLFSNR